MTLAPDLQLFDCSGAEGVARRQYQFLAIFLQASGELADGGGLACTVHTDHQNHKGTFRDGNLQRHFTGSQQCREFFLEAFQQRLGAAELLAVELLHQRLDDVFGGGQPHVGGQQLRLDVVEQRLVDGFAAKDQGAERIRQCRAGLAQTLAQARKQPAAGLLGRRRSFCAGLRR